MPDLFLSPAEWSALRDKLADPFLAKICADNARAIAAYDALQGTSLLDVPVDLSNPASPRAGGMKYRTIKGRLVCAAVALHTTGEDGAWDFASRTIDALLRHDFWTISSGYRIEHFNLKMGDLLYCAVFALEAFRERLDAARREQLIAVMIETGLAAYLRGWEAREWWREAEFNWGAATHGNAGLAALALTEIDPDLSERVLERARVGLAFVIDHLPLDGLWTEGAMYHATTLGHLSDFVIALYRSRGDDLGLLSNPRWFETLDSRRCYQAGDGGIFNFSNCSAMTVEWFVPQAYWWAQRLGRPEWIWFEDAICKPWTDTHGVFHAAESFLYRPANPPPTVAVEPAPLRHFRGLDWVTWQGAQTWLAFRGGDNGGNHNNLDLGHFILGRGRDRFLVDPGYGAFRTTQHNAVSIRGKDQTERSVAPVLHCRQLERGFHLACDLRACFPFLLERHVRQLVLLEDKHLFVIDALRGRHGLRVSAHYHFQTGLTAIPEADGVRIVGAESAMSITSLNGHAPAELSSWTFAGNALTEIRFHRRPDTANENSIFRLSFDPANAPTCELDVEGGRITFGGGLEIRL